MSCRVNFNSAKPIQDNYGICEVGTANPGFSSTNVVRLSQVVCTKDFRHEGCEGSFSFLGDLWRVKWPLKAKMLCRYMLLPFISECLRNSVIYLYLVNKYFFCLFLHSPVWDKGWFKCVAWPQSIPFLHGELKSRSWSRLTTFSSTVHFIKGSKSSSKSMLPRKLNKLFLRMLMQMSGNKRYFSGEVLI